MSLTHQIQEKYLKKEYIGYKGAIDQNGVRFSYGMDRDRIFVRGGTSTSYTCILKKEAMSLYFRNILFEFSNHCLYSFKPWGDSSADIIHFLKPVIQKQVLKACF